MRLIRSGFADDERHSWLGPEITDLLADLLNSPTPDVAVSWQMSSGSVVYQRSGSGLFVPSSLVPSMLNFLDTFLTLSDYSSSHQLMNLLATPEIEGLLEFLSASRSFSEMVYQLTILSHLAHNSTSEGLAVDELRAMLSQDARIKFDSVRQSKVVFARQPVLLALRTLLRNPDRPVQMTPVSQAASILLVHASGDLIQQRQLTSTDTIADRPPRADCPRPLG